MCLSLWFGALACLPACLPRYLPTYLLICLSIRPPACRPFRPSVHLSVLSIHLSVYLPVLVCVGVCACVCVFAYVRWSVFLCMLSSVPSPMPSTEPSPVPLSSFIDCLHLYPIPICAITSLCRRLFSVSFRRLYLCLLQAPVLHPCLFLCIRLYIYAGFCTLICALIPALIGGGIYPSSIYLHFCLRVPSSAFICRCTLPCLSSVLHWSSLNFNLDTTHFVCAFP